MALSVAKGSCISRGFAKKELPRVTFVNVRPVTFAVYSDRIFGPTYKEKA
jgi:hypothetical protein